MNCSMSSPTWVLLLFREAAVLSIPLQVWQQQPPLFKVPMTLLAKDTAIQLIVEMTPA